MVTYDPSVEEMLVQGQDRFVWETKLYPTYQRGPRWYFFFTAGAILLVSYAVITNNFLFAFLILLCAIILVLAGNEEAPTVLAQVGDLGVVWDGKLHLYRDIINFSIIYQPPFISTLYLETRSLSQPRLRISLEDQDPGEIRDHLRSFLSENTDLQTEQGSDILGRLLRI
ncbi:hypothetical protein KBD34_04145 [Patescibacteria group bacterium]|nr:hypothetical protein [Patescibacteria group bacterium]